jgi:hypothetical protein
MLMALVLVPTAVLVLTVTTGIGIKNVYADQCTRVKHYADDASIYWTWGCPGM